MNFLVPGQDIPNQTIIIRNPEYSVYLVNQDNFEIPPGGVKKFLLDIR